VKLEVGPRFKLSVLGGFILSGPEGVVGLPNKKLAALLTYLGCTAPVPQPRERLWTLLWGSHFDAQARQSLRQAIFKLRLILGPEAIESDGEFVWLNAAVVFCDVAGLNALIRDGSFDALLAAADLYRGQLADDVGVREEGWSDWLAGERERYQDLALNALVGLGQKELDAGRFDEALKAGQRANALNHLREDAHRLIMQALSGTGRKAEALKYYQDVVSLLKRELMTDPDLATRALASELRSRKSSDVLHPEGEAHNPQPEGTAPAVVKAFSAAFDDGLAANAKSLDDLEQRHLTILVCKLVGTLPDHIDAEDIHDLIVAFHRMAAELVAEFDGFDAHYQGSGVLIYFGYPSAHEHDAEQAVRAARAVLDAVGKLKTSFGTPLQASAGIASGLVVVGEKVTTGNQRQHVAIGDAPNLAARLQAVAASGEIVIADSTRRLVGQMFDCRAFSTAEDNGLPPLAAWKVDGERAVASRFHARRGPVMSPLMGRQEEVDLLLRRWRQAMLGDGRVVLLSGEPGIGKSRIAENLLASVENELHLCLRFSCSPHHLHSSLHPVIDYLNRVANFKPDSLPREKRDRLRDLLAPVTDQVARDVMLFSDLMGIPDDLGVPAPSASPEQKREMTFAMLLEYLQGAARRRPILAIIEDVHWIDPTSMDFLDRIVTRIAALPILLVITFRPEFQPIWSDQPNVTMLALNRLGRRDSAGIIGGITRGEQLPDDVVEQILARTDGVPLFIEEFTIALIGSRLLQETAESYPGGVSSAPMAIPTTLQDSLAAQLDRLGTARDVARIGATIGRKFSHELIAAVSGWPSDDLDTAIGRLLDSGLISSHGTPPDVGYSFKHALVRDAAYVTMLRAKRRQLHAAVADSLVKRFPAVVESEPETLARHFEEAGLAGDAIGQWVKAARLARTRWANHEAVEFFEKALGLLAVSTETSETMETAVDVRLELRAVLAQLAEPRRALECLCEAEILANRLEDHYRHGRIHALMTNAHTLLAELDKALVCGERALKAADHLADARLRIVATTYLEQAHFFKGDYRIVVDLATENVARLQGDWKCDFFGLETPPSVYDRGWLMMSLAELGRFKEASEPAAVTHRTAVASRHVHAIGWADISAATVHMLKGEWADALPLLERSTEMSKKGNVGVLHPSLVVCLAWVTAQLGDANRAESLFNEGERLVRLHNESGYIGLLGWLFLRLGRTALALGQLEHAQRLGDRVLETSRHQPGFQAHAHLLLGDIAILSKSRDAEAGEPQFRRALALAQKLGMSPLVAHSRHGLCKIHRRAGRLDQANGQFEAATAMYREMDMAFWLDRAEFEIRQG
jgi:class 3 adenylate cyclase/DNA-binding SARP family transcriptional activator